VTWEKKEALDQEAQELFRHLSATVERWNANAVGMQQELAGELATARQHLERLHNDEAGDAPAPSSENADEVRELRASLEALREENVRLQAAAGGHDSATRLRGLQEDSLRQALEEKEQRIEHLESMLAEAREEINRLGRQTQAVEAASHDAIEEARAAARARSHTSIDTLEPVDALGHKKRMGQLLVEAGVITERQLEELLSEQATAPGRRFGDLVVQRGYTNEQVVAHILARQLHLAFVVPEPGTIDRHAVAALPAQLARRHRCIPLLKESGRLFLVMTNPLDLIAIEDVEIATGHRVEPMVGTASDIEAAIARYYGPGPAAA